MFAIEIPWDPYLFTIGLFHFTWHSLLAVIGIIGGVMVARRLAPRSSITTEQVTTLALWGVAASIVVARALYVIDEWEIRFADNIAGIFQLNQGGITVWGAIIGGTIGVGGAAWWMRLPVREALDIGAPGTILGMGVGRIGDLINGEHHALASDLPWAVSYTHPNTLGQGPMRPGIDQFPVHPATTYELLGDFLIFAGAVWLVYRYMGSLATYWYVVAGYSALRLGLQFLRIDQTELFLGLQQSQVIGIIGIMAAGVWAARRLVRGESLAKAPVLRSPQSQPARRHPDL